MSRGDGDRGKGHDEGHEKEDEFEVREVVPAVPEAVDVSTSDSGVSEGSEASKE
jgi:hypothetical protein